MEEVVKEEQMLNINTLKVKCAEKKKTKNHPSYFRIESSEYFDNLFNVS